MKAQRGQWCKQTGGDNGIWFDGRKWQPFECLGCMFARGLIHPHDRLGAEKFAIMSHALATCTNNPAYLHHDRELHNRWLATGKPITAKPVSD